MSHSSVCWQCGASLAALSLPFSRFDACKVCGAALHACKQCVFYELTVARHCREPVAEAVRDKQRSNGCDYFSPRADAYQKVVVPTDSHAELAALFGSASAPQTVASDVVSEQIRNKADVAAAARTALDNLFK